MRRRSVVHRPRGSVGLMLLERIDSPSDLRGLDASELEQLAREIRAFIVRAVAATGGHLGSNLGAVELTLALHRTFDSPRDVILWDTGHQAYVHKLVTGRRDGFSALRQAGGLSGYPSRAESPHDWIENSHASTVLSYAHGLVSGFERGPDPGRRVVAVVGDGALTGGMAYEALNNLGHAGKRLLIVLNDNGRSYAPTVSRLSDSLIKLRLSPRYVAERRRLERLLGRLPGGLADFSTRYLHSVQAGFRTALQPPAFFECLGVRYTGPIDGHDIAEMEAAFEHATAYDGPIVVHVVTQKGRGYQPAEDDDEKNLHDTGTFDPVIGPLPTTSQAHRRYTDVFGEAICDLAADDPAIVALTAAMSGPTGSLPFAARHPDRILDVGIAEQHMVTAAAGMAMSGLRPVVAVYSTFLVARVRPGQPRRRPARRERHLRARPRRHHRRRRPAATTVILDLALCLRIPGMTVFAPSSAQELRAMLATAVKLDGPAAVRFPKGPAREVDASQVGHGLTARKVRTGTDVCIVAVGRMLEAAEDAAAQLAHHGVDATLWDARVVAPLDPAMIADAAAHPVVVTVEDGVRLGGAGQCIADAVAALDEGRRCPPVLVLGVPLRYLPQGGPLRILADLGLDGPGITASVRKLLAA